jgi:hypothetical protein
MGQNNMNDGMILSMRMLVKHGVVVRLGCNNNQQQHVVKTNSQIHIILEYGTLEFI